jgi:Winged helix DNA-binding domain
MTDEHRKRVCVGAVVEPTVLVDGDVVAIWKLVRAPDTATLEIELLTRLSGTDRAAVAQEGERLLVFSAADAGDHDIRFVAPGR